MVGGIYHICNRGIRKEKIFQDEADYHRFVINLYRLNNKEGSLRINSYRDTVDSFPEQEKIVEILKWSLLPNHYHLVLYEKIDGGVLEFVKRLGNAFTKYINIKKDSSGYVFQNSAKIIPINTDKHFLHIPFYVDLNPVDLKFHGWKENKKNQSENIFNFLNNYKWSSFKDYYDDESVEHAKIINKDLFYDIYGTNSKKYLKDLKNILKGDWSTWQVDQ